MQASIWSYTSGGWRYGLCLTWDIVTVCQTFTFSLATFEGDLDEQAALISAVGEQADAAIIITNQIATFAEVCSWVSLQGTKSQPKDMM